MGSSFLQYCELDEKRQPAEHRQRCDKALACRRKRKATLFALCFAVCSDIRVLH